MTRRAATLLGPLGLAVASLLVLREPSYDPTGWLIWGRQIVHGTLATTGGPSWKPLPVAFTTVFALAGAATAPLLWLVVARTAGLLALILAYLVTRRLGGRLGAAFALVALALAREFLFNAARGDSEGLLVALVLGAVLLHLDGRPWWSLGAMAAAALLRPEPGLVLAAQGLCLARSRRSVKALLAVVAIGLGAAALWLVPELIGSGDALRAATRAQNPVPGSPAQAAFPFAASLRGAFAVLPWPVWGLAVLGGAAARRRRAVLAIAAAVAVLGLLTAIESELGFTGNPRYYTLAVSGACVLAGLGVERLARLRRDVAVVTVVLAVVAFAATAATGALRTDLDMLTKHEQVFGRELPALIRRAGGAAAIRACGPLSATPFQRQAVAYRLDVAQQAVTTRSLSTGTLIGRRKDVRRSPLRRRLRTAHLALRSTCVLPPS